MRKAYSLGKACSWNPSDNPPVVELIRRSDNWSYIWKELKHFYLVVKVFGAIVGHGHNVRVVVLVVIVEAVKKEAKPNPAVNRTVYMTSGWAFCALRKQGLTKDKRLSMFTFAAVYQKARPSAPILPLPVTLKVRSTSHLGIIRLTFETVVVTIFF